MKRFFNNFWTAITMVVALGLLLNWTGLFDRFFPQPSPESPEKVGVPYNPEKHRVAFSTNTYEGIQQAVVTSRAKPGAVSVYKFQNDAMTRQALDLLSQKSNPFEIAQMVMPFEDEGINDAYGAYETILLAYGMAVKIIRWRQGTDQAAEMIITSQNGETTGASLRMLPIREGVPYIPGQSSTISVAALQQAAGSAPPKVVQDSSLIRGLRALGYSISNEQEVITNYQALFPNQRIPYATRANGRSQQVQHTTTVPVQQER